MPQTSTHPRIPTLVALLAASLLTIACTSDSEAAPRDPSMHPLTAYISAHAKETPPPDRLELLEPLAQAIAAHEGLQATFVCTHNSRRSHLSQIWAQAAAWHYGLDDVATFSGGTEATAFNPRAVAALQRAGFTIEAEDPEAHNPVYRVTFDDDHPAMRCFSKCYADPCNPDSDFAAVMTCADADDACPLVEGATHRFAITYVDPKEADGTSTEAATYDQRCAQIAREMLWVMRRAAQLRRR